MDSDLESTLRTTGFKQLLFKYTTEVGEEIRPSYQLQIYLYYLKIRTRVNTYLPFKNRS